MSNYWNLRFWEYEFFEPHWLWLLILVPIVWIVLFKRERQRKGDIKFSGGIEHQKKLGTNWVARLREGLIILSGLALAALILALAKPYHWELHDDSDRDFKYGIDIVIAMDVSGSMLAEDFDPNRLEASKRVAKEFIDGRKGDRIGLVAYAGEAYTACPPTLDYEVLKKQITRMNGDRIMGGTSIGLGLGTAVTRLRKDSTQTGSKVIILLTDGVDGGVELDPMMAAELAKSQDIRVYTIGVGSTGTAKAPVKSPFGPYYASMEIEIDEDLLKRIAKVTDGRYFRAKDEDGLKKIYEEIDKLEKKRIVDEQYKSEPPPTPQSFVNVALFFAALVWCLQFFLFKSHD
ncbi:MAG: VWA domain-containing protein [bacterium]|nr:VWA domain-containing protein [bacterium]